MCPFCLLLAFPPIFLERGVDDVWIAIESWHPCRNKTSQDVYFKANDPSEIQKGVEALQKMAGQDTFLTDQSLGKGFGINLGRSYPLMPLQLVFYWM